MEFEYYVLVGYFFKFLIFYIYGKEYEKLWIIDLLYIYIIVIGV